MRIKPEVQAFLDTVHVDAGNIPAGVFQLESIQPVALNRLTDQIKQAADQGQFPPDQAFAQVLNNVQDTDLLTRLNTGLHGTAVGSAVTHRLEQIHHAQNIIHDLPPADSRYAALETNRGAALSSLPQPDPSHGLRKSPEIGGRDAARHAMRKQHAASDLPTKYGSGNNEVKIIPDHDGNGKRNGTFTVMTRSPDGQGWVGVEGVTAAELAKVRQAANNDLNRAFDDPHVKLADMVREAGMPNEAGRGPKASLMAQLGGEQDRLTMAQLRAAQAGTDPYKAVASEPLPQTVQTQAAQPKGTPAKSRMDPAIHAFTA